MLRTIVVTTSQWVGNYLAGGVRAFVVIVPLMLVALLLYAVSIVGLSNDCRGDCAVGVGQFVIAILILGARFGVAGIVLYAVAFLISRATWKAGRVQYIGAFTLVPALLMAALAWQTYASFAADARVDKSLLSRSNPNPVGMISHLLIIDHWSNCERCPLYVLNGVANRVSLASLAPTGKLTIKNSYRKASGNDCALRKGTVYFQKSGLFNTCAVNDSDDTIASGAIAVSIASYYLPLVKRPDSLKTVGVAFAVADGRIGSEILRWEHGRNRETKTEHGEKFTEDDFVRALTGNHTDRQKEFDASTFNERLAVVTSWIGRTPMNPKDVTSFLNARTSDQNVNQRDVRSAFKAICAGSPAADFLRSFDLKSNNCVRHYNDWIGRFGSRFTDAARLPDPSS